MRVLHVVPTYLPAIRYGGPIYSVHGLCRSLASQGHDVHVFTTNVDGETDARVCLTEPVNVDGVKVSYFPSRHLRRFYWAPDMLREFKKRVAEFDIVHTHSIFLWPTWAAAREARRLGVPYVSSPRGMLDKALVRRKSRWAKTMWIHLIERRNLEHAATVHATSQFEIRAIMAFGLNLGGIVRIANGVDSPGTGNEITISPDVARVLRHGEYVLYLGRINWKKGLDRLIDAWDSRNGCRLVIAGNDEEDYAQVLRARAEALGHLDIEVIGRSVTEADKEALFASASLFVLPSYSENFGNTVLEAMVRGIPVLVTDEVGAGELVVASGGGTVIPGSALREGMKEMLSDPEASCEMGHRGRAYVLEHCSWEIVASQMARLYERCITQSRCK